MFNEDKYDAIILHMAKNNPKTYNTMKALEEAGEFSEVLIKLETKHPSNKSRPDRNNLIKEFGDLFYRGLVAIMSEFPEYTVEDIAETMWEHVEKKLDNLIKHKEAGKYQGGL